MSLQKIEKVAVIGTGTLGTQIALQAAFYGTRVTAYDPDHTQFERMLKMIRFRIQNSGKKATPAFEDIPGTAKKIILCSSLEEALRDVDLVIEAVPEDIPIKREVFGKLDAIAPKKAILATNSSSIPISKIESATGRPEKCMNIHFYALEIKQGMADVMGGTRTSDDTFDQGREWVRSIGCIPLAVNKESLGFCFNRVWRAVKRETLHMWADGISDFQDIDRGWMVFTGMAQGPFGMMDNIGLDVVYGIEMVYYEESRDLKDYPPEKLKAMIDRKEMGVKTGKGFYTYPNPAYKDPSFLKKGTCR
ncbi:MAG: putative 3-hydroxyacyl-CoA dehydrogenase [uncultured bacterium]|nr:MAG: putative 3-hydroxyacyl-CoA dehydrogenase [uncultured bacterium]